MMAKRILKNKQATLGIGIILALILAAILAPVLAPHDPGAMNVLMKFEAPSSEYPLGTDELGRCILSRLIYGTRYSLGVAIPIVLIVFCVSLAFGTLSAYCGGLVDHIFIVLCDVVMAFPPMALVLAFVSGLGQSLTNLFIALVFTMWAGYAKIVRSYVLQEKAKGYIAAARICESSSGKIIFRHIIPNIIPPLFVKFTISVGEVIIMLSGFSYVGVGVGKGVPEWGAMLSNAKQYIYSDPQLILYPGLCILICVAGFNLFGEALRDIVSPENKL